MKPLSNAERQKRRIEKLKNEGKYEDFKKEKAEARRLSCLKQKENMTEKESEEIARLKKLFGDAKVPAKKERDSSSSSNTDLCKCIWIQKF